MRSCVALHKITPTYVAVIRMIVALVIKVIRDSRYTRDSQWISHRQWSDRDICVLSVLSV